MKKIWIIGFVMLLITIASAMAVDTHNATSINLVAGTWTAGNVTSTFIKGEAGANNTYNFSGVAATPGFDIRFNISDVTENRNSYDISVYARGDGVDHVIRFQGYNFTSNAWETISTASSFGGYSWKNMTIYTSSYITTNEMWLRIYQADKGNPTQDFSIDYFQIIESDTEEISGIEFEGNECPINSIQSTMLYIFIGLIIIGLAIFASYSSILFFSIIISIVGMLYSFPLWGCNPIYGLVIFLGFVFYGIYETFWRRFTDKK